MFFLSGWIVNGKKKVRVLMILDGSMSWIWKMEIDLFVCLFRPSQNLRLCFQLLHSAPADCHAGLGQESLSFPAL